jgi:predicted ATPase
MIEQLTLRGLKSFEDETTLEFAPVTLLTGTNSSGKSTILQALLLLNQAFDQPSHGFAGVILNGPRLALGSYQDVSSKGNLDPFELEVQLKHHLRDPRGSLLHTAGFKFGVVEKDEGRAALLNASYKTQSITPEEPEARPALSPDSGCGRLEIGIEKVGLVDDACSPQVGIEDEDASLERFSFQASVEHDGTPMEEEAMIQVRGLQLRKARITSRTPEAIWVMYEFLGELPLLLAALRQNQMDTAKGRFKIRRGEQLEKLIGTKTESNRFLKFLDKSTDVELVQYLEVNRNLLAESFYRALSLDELLSFDDKLDEEASERRWLRKTRGMFSPSFLRKRKLDPDRFRSRPATKKEKESSERAKLIQSRLIERVSTLVQKLPALPAEEAPTPDLLSAQEKYPHLLPFLDLLDAWSARIGDDQQRLQKVADAARDGKLAQCELAIDHWIDRIRDDGHPLSGHILHGVEYLANSIHHLGPLRDEPRNLYPLRNPAQSFDVGARGENAIACLRMYGAVKIRAPRPGAGPESMSLQEAVILWCKHLGVVEDYTLEESSKFGTLFKVQIPGGSEKDTMVDLTNVGVGVSQVLPIIVLCLAVPPLTTILLEQPELHLHPAIQTRLADFFFACSKLRKQVILETHSEHIVNGLRLLAVRNQADAGKDFKIAFLMRDEDGSTAIPIEVGKDGSIADWPEGFFDESTRVLSEIVSERLGDG